MIGLDTNVLLRLFDKTDVRQSAQAEAAVRNQPAGSCYINLIVICEFVWTLARSYKEKRALIVQRVELLLEAPEFTLQHGDEVQRALKSYQTGKADFADYLLAEINLSAGCTATLTFDRMAAESGAFSLVEG